MSERYTFIDIYKKDLDLNKEKKVKVNQVVIPKIQRPYAQGRLDGVCTYVRNTLLNEMFENFKTDEIFDFNFVYGIVRPNNDEYVMELLDGQQRMTTLFLLYWYIANRELNEGEEKDSEIRDALARFVYETRTTSTVFCQRLASYRIDLSSTLPSKAIRNGISSLLIEIVPSARCLQCSILFMSIIRSRKTMNFTRSLTLFSSM